MRFKYSLLITMLLLFLLPACFLVKKQRVARVSDSQQVEVAQKKLIEATIELLATSKAEKPLTYSERKQSFEEALANYFKLTGYEKQTTLTLEHDGITFILPLQIIETGHAPPLITRSTKETVLGDIVRKGFGGEILDMNWLSAQKDQQKRLVILFSDSLVNYPWPGDAKSQFLSFGFKQNLLRPIRSAYPAGIFQYHDLDNDNIPEIIALTSSLTESVLIQSAKDKLQLIQESEGLIDSTLLTAWHIPSGQDIFRSFHPGMASYRSMRTVAAGKYKSLLDENGYLNLMTSDLRETLWKSKRAYGDRLFVLDSDTIAVCDSRKSFFILFHLENQHFRLLGRSPDFRGTVKAVLPAELKNQYGFVVGISTRAANGIPESRLQFIPSKFIYDSSLTNFEEPKFPHFYKKLTFVQELGTEHLSLSGPRQFPPVVQFNVFQSLFRSGDFEKPVPVLASGIVADSTRKTWDIHLRSGVRFSDGSLLTAHQVIESWKRNWIHCEKTNCTHRWLWSCIKGAEEFVTGKRDEVTGIDIPNRSIIRLQLNEPRPNFVEHLTQLPFQVTKLAENRNAVLGTGPFSIERFQSIGTNTSVLCQRNSYNYDGQPPLKEIEFIFQKKNVIGQVHKYDPFGAMIRRKEDVDYFSQMDELQLRPHPNSSIYFLALNPSVEPLAEIQHRLQVAKAFLNRKILKDVINEGECEITKSFFASRKLATPSLTRNSSIRYSRPLRIAFSQSDQVARQIAERLSARLSQLKIPNVAPWGLPDEDFDSLRKSGRYDILIDSYDPCFNAPLYNLTQLIKRGYVVNTGLNSLVEGALASSSPDNYVVAIENMLVERVILYPLVRCKYYTALPKELEGTHLSGVNEVDFSKSWLPDK